MLMDSFIFCNLRVTSHAKIERNTSVGACSHKRLFRSIFIPCVQRTHSTAVNEINVERPLRHIYELNAWLVTQGCRKPHERPRRTEHHALMSRHDIPSTVGVLFTDSAKIHRITENSGINVWGVNNFLHNCRKDLKQRNCFFYRTFFYSISTIFISLRLF